MLCHSCSMVSNSTICSRASTSCWSAVIYFLLLLPHIKHHCEPDYLDQLGIISDVTLVQPSPSAPLLKICSPVHQNEQMRTTLGSTCIQRLFLLLTRLVHMVKCEWGLFCIVSYEGGQSSPPINGSISSPVHEDYPGLSRTVSSFRCLHISTCTLCMRTILASRIHQQGSREQSAPNVTPLCSPTSSSS